MKPIDELTRVIECKVGATWNYASNVVDLDATLAPGFFNGRFPDRQMRVADRVEVTGSTVSRWRRLPRSLSPPLKASR